MDAELEDLLIFSGSSCPHLAQPIATKLKMDLAGIRLGCFADGENFAELLVNVRGKMFLLFNPSAVRQTTT